MKNVNELLKKEENIHSELKQCKEEVGLFRLQLKKIIEANIGMNKQSKKIMKMTNRQKRNLFSSISIFGSAILFALLIVVKKYGGNPELTSILTYILGGFVGIYFVVSNIILKRY